MKPEDRKRVHVDYNCRPDLVYAETTALLIERHQSLAFLVWAFSYRSSQSQPSLPSWVLDFGDCQEDRLFSDVGSLMSNKFFKIRVTQTQHQASADTRPSVCFHGSSLKLGVEAIIFDSAVASTITIPGRWACHRQSKSERIESEREWIRSAIKVLEASLQTKPDPRSYLFQIYDIRRLLFDFFSSDPTSIPEPEIPIYLDSDSRAFEFDVEGSADSNRLPDWFDTVTTGGLVSRDIPGFFRQYTLFTTTSGLAGVAEYDKRASELRGDTEEAQSACSGDMIAIPLGSDKPWILRKTGADGEYRLIVDCVIPEIMSGELMQLVEAKKMETQWVTLL